MKDTIGLTESQKQQALDLAQDLIDFIDQSPTAWQAVANIKDRLKTNGFEKFEPLKQSQLTPGDKGYFTVNDSGIMIFRIGDNPLAGPLRIFGAHTDSPSLRIKPVATSESCGIMRLNTEVYGGPILNTWFDRPLSLAGRVFLKSADPFHPESRLIDLKKPLLILPNLAIHMNREVNEGVKIERHLHLLPFLQSAVENNHNDQSDEIEAHDPLKQLLAEHLKVLPEDIISYDLRTYETAKGELCGLKNEFISCSRLDNLAMCFSGMDAFLNTASSQGVQILLFTDNEEVGSGSKQGADSMFARDALEQIYNSLGADRTGFLNALQRAFMISADLAHAVHPNYSNYADPDHRPLLNHGPAIKHAANQSYATDGDSAAVFRTLCAKAKIPCQDFVNRSDLRGGSTIGPITSCWLPVRTVDIGTAIWGMHSVRETGGAYDVYYMRKLLEVYFAD